MAILFWKMHGAGNDFILVDDRQLGFPAADTAFIRRICDRRRGIGSDGLLLIQPSAAGNIKMRFFNPDGSLADMCGNGARCLARLAFEILDGVYRDTYGNHLRLEQVRLYETPNCWSDAIRSRLD